MTDWEERYQKADTPWDKGRAHPGLVAWLARQPLRGKVLVPGCGSGHDVRVLARQGAEVLGLDVAPSAIRAAQAHPAVGSERYALGDFFAPPPEWSGAFDGLFEHTCFCAIDPADRPRYARAAAQVVRPGGVFLAIFYLNPDHDEPGPPFGCTPDDLDRLFVPNFRLIGEEDALETFPGRENRELLRVYERVA
jgi:SAM-dependent methyltransferase